MPVLKNRGYFKEQKQIIAFKQLKVVIHGLYLVLF